MSQNVSKDYEKNNVQEFVAYCQYKELNGLIEMKNIQKTKVFFICTGVISLKSSNWFISILDFVLERIPINQK